MFIDRSGNFKGNRNKFNLDQYYASGRMPSKEQAKEGSVSHDGSDETVREEAQCTVEKTEGEEDDDALGAVFGGLMDDY